METKYIKITEYCTNENIESSFILELNKEGIVHIETRENNQYLAEEDLPALEMFKRWHYDLGINLEGIDAMRHMVERMRAMQKELNQLRKQTKFLID
ncbi:MAG: chaperone modulator CbpM [Weeksellaceae bacterium]